MKRKFLLLSVTAALVIFCAGCGKNTDIESTGYVTFTAVDGISGLPIDGVRIVLPESGTELFTDSDGKSNEAEVKVLCDSRFLHPQEYGTFSVFAFKEGYCDYALFYAQIKPDEKRKMKIFLFSDESPLSKGLPISIIESPDEEWVEQYMSEYR